MVRYGIHLNFSNRAKYLNLALKKSTILMVWMSRVLLLSYKRSNFVLSSLLRKLASKVVEAGAYGGACGGAHDDNLAWDDSPHFKSPNLIRLVAGGSLKAIENQKMMSRPKFT